MNQFAPVFFTTLNRFEHFKRGVETLSVCTNADKTEIYIALDYPLNESHWDGYRKIVGFIEKIQGFKKVNVIKRNTNYGSYKNFFDALEDIFEKHDKLILSEDDNEFSPNFLDYINSGLAKYEENDFIFSICGTNFPIKMPDTYNHDVYFYPGFSSWGVGIWKKKWEKIDFNVDHLKKYLSDKNNIKEIKKTAAPVLPYLKEVVKTGRINGDTIIVYYLLKKNMFSVFPCLSKVRNHGHDGSGVNCEPSKLYKNIKIDDGTKKIEFLDKIIIDEKINNQLEKMFSNKLWYRGIRKIKKLLLH